MKKTTIIVKFGGGAFGVDGRNTAKIVERIVDLERMYDVGPLVVASAPQTVYNEDKKSLTDVAIHIGEQYSNSSVVSIEPLFEPYRSIVSRFVDEKWREVCEDEIKFCKQRVSQALQQVMENRRFVDVNRARVLAYSGEILTAAIFDYVLRSSNLDSYHPDKATWPIVTDDNFENANFLFKESCRRIQHIEEQLEYGRVPVVGGYVGYTSEGLETTFERGGSDRTAADLAILLSGSYRVEVDFEKDSVVKSADPNIVKDDLRDISCLSYNEAELAGRFGMKIIDPIAIRDIEEAGLNIPLHVTDLNTPTHKTHIVKRMDMEEDLIKIVVGKKCCSILDMDKAKRDSLEDYLKRVRRYYEFMELRPYVAGGRERARFLFLDELYVERHEKELKSFSQDTVITYGLGAITLVGDRMGSMPGIAARAFDAVFKSGINIEDGDVQNPTSSILIVVKNESVEDAVRAIHKVRAHRK